MQGALEPILSNPASVIFRSVSNRTGEDRLEKSLGVAQQWVPPSQYSVTLVLGVVPPTTSVTSPSGFTAHRSGISPSSESTRRSGKRS